MKIKVNGEEKKIELDRENALLSTALNLMGYKPNTIVVELNNLIINSIKWEKVKLKDGDNLESSEDVCSFSTFFNLSINSVRSLCANSPFCSHFKDLELLSIFSFILIFKY